MKGVYFVFLFVLFAPIITCSQIVYKGGNDQLTHLFERGVRVGNSWEDSSVLSSKIYLVQFAVQPNGTVMTCNIFGRGQKDSVETNSIFETCKKTQGSWQNFSGKTEIVLVPIILIKQGDKSAEETEKTAKAIFSAYNIVSYSDWLPTSPLIAKPVISMIGFTMRKQLETVEK